jgi:hypothetical protein
MMFVLYGFWETCIIWCSCCYIWFLRDLYHMMFVLYGFWETLIIWCSCCLTVTQEEQLTLPEHLISPPVCSGFHVAWSLVFCVVFCRSFCPFSFGNCCRSIYSFWLPLWYLQTFLKKVNWSCKQEIVLGTKTDVFASICSTDLAHECEMNPLQLDWILNQSSRKFTGVRIQVMWNPIVPCRSYCFSGSWNVWLKEFEDTKQVIRIHKSKDRQTPWAKEKGQRDIQRSTKHTHKAKDRVTQTPKRNRSESFRIYRKVGIQIIWNPIVPCHSYCSCGCRIVQSSRIFTQVRFQIFFIPIVPYHSDCSFDSIILQLLCIFLKNDSSESGGGRI